MTGEVLSDNEIKGMIDAGYIIGANPKLINPGSLDLRLGDNKWRLIGSILPLENQRVEEVLRVTPAVDARDDKTSPFYLDTSNPYIFELVEKLNLPSNISGRVFNKSGRGRIGTSVRVLCDKVQKFDSIPLGYQGKLHVEVRPTIFPELVAPGETAMPQIRFYHGSPKPLSGASLELYLEKEPILVDKKNHPINFSRSDLNRICDDGKFTFTADLSRNLLAYRARRDGKALDLSQRGFYNPFDFFEEVRSRNGEQGLLIHPGEFVLVHSNEKIRLPLSLAAEIADYSSEIGDFKSHYAGLINPGHGFNTNKITGEHIVFEIRARDTPIFLQHGQPLAQFQVYKMSQCPEVGYMEKKSTGYSSLPDILPTIFNKDKKYQVK